MMPALYGSEIYRIGFGEAVEKGLLTDYKVLILTLSDKDVPLAVQNMISKESEINTDDLSKLVGCVNALSKQFIGDDGRTKEIDPEPMRRAVAFCPTHCRFEKDYIHFQRAERCLSEYACPGEEGTDGGG